MLFRTDKDWKQLLTPEDEDKLNNILRTVAKHRGAFRNSEDIRNAQLWCSDLELKKENMLLRKRLERIEDILDGVFNRFRKQEDEKRKMVESLERF